jgi:flagellar hook-associated protein 2
MSSGTFVGGLVSGIDTASLINSLMTLERRPRDLLASRRTTIASQQSLMQDFKSKITALRDAARAIDNRTSDLGAAAASEELLAFKATSSDDDIVTATASGTSNAGTYSVRVEQLARVGREFSRGFASDTSIIANSGETMTIDYGGTADITLTIGASGSSLRNLRDAINTDANNGANVRAEIVYDGSTYRLLVSGVTTGATHDVSVTTTIQGPSATTFLDPTLEQTAQNSSIKVLGLTVTRESNTVSDALPGVTLTLAGTHSVTDTADASTVTVSRDDSAISAKLQKLVDAYNGVRDFVSGQITPDAKTKRGGPLSTDATLRDVERRIQTALVNEYDFSGNLLNGLSSIGLSFDSKGKLKLDSAKLTTALDSNPQSVRQLLSGDGTTNGLATSIASALDDVLDSADGVIATRESGFTARIKDIDTQLDRIDRQLSQKELSLRLKFAALESTLAGLQSQSGYLSKIGG